MSLAAKSQIAFRLEDDEGTPETLTASDLVEVLADSFPNISQNQEFVPRNVARGSLTNLPGLAGGRDSKLSLQSELAGSLTSAMAEPGFSKMLKACGMKYVVAEKINIFILGFGGGVTAPNEHVLQNGDTLAGTGGTLNALRGLIIGNWYAKEDSFIVYEVTTASSDSLETGATMGEGHTALFLGGLYSNSGRTAVNCWIPIDDVSHQIACSGGVATANFTVGLVIEGATSGAKGRITKLAAVAATNIEFELLTYRVPFVSGDVITVVGGTPASTATATANQVHLHSPSATAQSLHKGPIRKMKGVRGNWSLVIKNKDRGIFNFEFEGCGLAPTDGDNLVSTSLLNAIPPIVVGSSLSVGTGDNLVAGADSSFIPLYGQIEYKSGNQLSLRESPSDTSASGYLSTQVVDREMSADISWEAVRQAVFDAATKAYSKGAIRIKQTVGDGSTQGSQFHIRCANVQISENPLEEQDGILHEGNSLMLTTRPDGLVTTGDDEFFLFQY